MLFVLITIVLVAIAGLTGFGTVDSRDGGRWFPAGR